MLTATLFCLFNFIACKDNGSGGNPPEPPNEANSLVGTWYGVGSTDELGKKVVFTETNVTASHYANDYKIMDTSLTYDEKWNDNARYLLYNDTLEILDMPINLDYNNHNVLVKTKITFYSKFILKILCILKFLFLMMHILYILIILIL